MRDADKVLIPRAAPADKPLVESLTAPTQDAISPAGAALRDKALKTLGALPPFSPILNRLLASLAGEDVVFSKLADLIEKDTVVAGNVLHLVNSALYGRRGTVNSVRHALSLLGINRLRNAVLGMSISRMWKQVKPAASWSMSRFNMHSAAAAILSDLLAQRLPVNYAEGAFVAGLLHDLGRMLIAVCLPAEHDQVLERHRTGKGPVSESERSVLGFTHSELSGQALALWNLPEAIHLAARDHHAAPGAAAPSGELTLSRVVAAADQYVHSTGVSILPQRAPGKGADVAVLERLGIDSERLEKLLAEFQAEFEAMSQFFH